MSDELSLPKPERTRKSSGEGGRENAELLATAIAGLAGVAYADFVVAETSLGLLYLLPITLASLTGLARYALPLTLACVFLREWLGPFESGGGAMFLRLALAGAGYFFVSWLTVRRSSERFRLRAQRELQREQLAADLALGAETQRLLLPETAPKLEGFQIAAKMFPARIVGGDYFDFLERRPGRLGMAIGDVSGKGIAAGMLMPALGAALAMGLEANRDPDELVSAVDRVLYASTSLARYATLVYAELDSTGKVLTYCNAGHPSPILLRSGDGSVLRLDTGGPPIGLLPGSRYTAGTVRLGEGDVLVMYTDGLSDAEDISGTPIGRDGVAEWVRKHRGLTANALLEALKSELEGYSEGQQLADDCTILVVKSISRSGSTADDVSIG